MKKYLFARSTVNPMMVKFAKAFKKTGAKVESVSIYEPADMNKNIFDKCHYILPLSGKEKQKSKSGMALTYLSLAKNIRKITKPLKKTDLIIGVSEPNAFVYFIFKLARCKKIFLPYDISQLRYEKYRDNKWHDWLFEKSNFKMADAIIHKAPKEIFNKISDKKNLQFLPYAYSSTIEKTKKLDGTHLAYVGLVYNGRNIKGTYPLHNVFKELVNNNLHVHVYPTNYTELKRDIEYKNLEKNDFFHLHKPIKDTDLKKELSKYHWGLYILYFDKTFRREWADSVFGNKVSNYLEAGLPTIANRGLPFVCSIIEKYGIGLSVDHYTNISETIARVDYKELQKELQKNAKDFMMDKHEQKIIRFVEEIEDE